MALTFKSIEAQEYCIGQYALVMLPAGHLQVKEYPANVPLLFQSTVTELLIVFYTFNTSCAFEIIFLKAGTFLDINSYL